MQEKYVMDIMNNSFKENMKSIVEDGSSRFNSMVNTIDNQILNESANGKTIFTLTKDDLAKIMSNNNHRSYNNEIDIMHVNDANAYKANMLAWMYAIKYYYEQQGFNVILYQDQLLIAWSTNLDDIAADTLHNYLDLNNLDEPLSNTPLPVDHYIGYNQSSTRFDPIPDMNSDIFDADDVNTNKHTCAPQTEYPEQPIGVEPDEDDDLNFKSLEQTAPSAIDEPRYSDKDATQIRDQTKNSTMKFADDVKNLCLSDDSSCEDELLDHTLDDTQDLPDYTLNDLQDLSNHTVNYIQDLSNHTLDDTQDLPDQTLDDIQNLSDHALDDTQDMPSLDAQDDAIDADQSKKSSDCPNKMPDALNDENNPFMDDDVPNKMSDALNDEPDPFMEDEDLNNSKATKK